MKTKRPKPIPLWQRAWKGAKAALDSGWLFLIVALLVAWGLVICVAWPDLQVVLRRL